MVDFITPETETSHWYFWGMARNFQPDNAELTDQIREGQGKIFTEDLEMLEQQQQNILNNPHRKLLMLNIDAGGVQSRKVIERLLAEENKHLLKRPHKVSKHSDYLKEYKHGRYYSKIHQLTPTIRAFELVAANGTELPSFEAGAHIDVHLKMASLVNIHFQTAVLKTSLRHWCFT